MYCKNCGKYLEEGTRFCDRCGQSVRKSANSEQAVRHQNIEELKEERLNRKKRLAEMEAREAMKNKRKQKRRRQNRRIIVFLVLVLLLALISIIVTYSLTRSSSDMSGVNPAASTPSPQADNASNQNTTSSTVTDGSETSGTVQTSTEYRVFEINNVACPYPSDFSKKAVSGNEKLSLEDSDGGAIMSISQEQNVIGTPAEQMKEYAGTIGASPNYSLADKDSYALTWEKGGTVYHRKCIISGSTAIYYDFQYSAVSPSRARYEQCIAYIDGSMTVK